MKKRERKRNIHHMIYHSTIIVTLLIFVSLAFGNLVIADEVVYI